MPVYNTVVGDAESNDEGLFFERDVNGLMSFVLAPGGDAPQKHLISREWSETKKRLTAASLFQRAWVFQELIMAPRVLFFGKDQIHWQCSEFEACETFPDGKSAYAHIASDFMAPSGRWHGPPLKLQILDELNKKVEWDFSQNLWRNVVTAYTKCELSLLEDKLNAVAGVSSLFSSREDITCGMRRSKLPRDLLWYSEHISRYGRRPAKTAIRIPPDKCVAPSWSWAAVHGAVVIGSDGHWEHDMMTIRGISTSSDQLPLLQLRGRPVRARLISRETNMTCDTGEAGLVFPGDILEHMLTTLDYAHNQNYAKLDDPREMTSGEVLCLPVFRGNMSGHPIRGLVLAAEQSQGVTFSSLLTRRLGVFFTSRLNVFEDVKEANIEIV